MGEAGAPRDLFCHREFYPFIGTANPYPAIACARFRGIFSFSVSGPCIQFPASLTAALYFLNSGHSHKLPFAGNAGNGTARSLRFRVTVAAKSSGHQVIRSWMDDMAARAVQSALLPPKLRRLLLVIFRRVQKAMSGPCMQHERITSNDSTG